MKRLLLCAIGLTLCVAFAPQATADLEDGLVGYWPMDDNAFVPPEGRGFDFGSPKTPEVFWGFNASLTGPEPTEVNGKVGNALDFSSGGGVQFDGVPDIGTSDFSFACWVKGGGANFLYQDGGGGGTRLQTQIGAFNICDATGAGRLAMWIEDGAGGNGSLYTEISADGAKGMGWIHIAGVVDRDNDANTKYFLDGFPLQTDCGVSLSNAAGADLSSGATGQTLHIEHGFAGTLDEFVLYDRALSDDEVEQIFLRGSSGLPVVATDGAQHDVGAGPAGADGAAGATGAAGAAGAIGPQGPQGKQGPAGQDASCVDCADVESAVFDVVCKVFQGEIAPSSKDAVIECVQSIGVLALLGTEICDDTDCLGTIMANVDNLIAEKSGQ